MEKEKVKILWKKEIGCARFLATRVPVKRVWFMWNHLYWGLGGLIW
jgi:hypothetical protein